ncbi:Hypothetical protein CINCED_3A018651 [Cinara cedri]|uniref:Uncharacterized protein n=1 Tax=Cinara cedri TaxID=506608 RepID=A0A5E4MNL5_9HEMI|nr:Hypothetical protein CINCED_3A018651 [Cinara cedri]
MKMNKDDESLNSSEFQNEKAKKDRAIKESRKRKLENFGKTCQYAIAIFTDEKEIKWLKEFLNYIIYTTNVDNQLFSQGLKMYRIVDTFINNEDILHVESEENKDSLRSIAIRLLIGHFKNILCIYSEFISSIQKLHSLKDTGYNNISQYVSSIFQVFIQITTFTEMFLPYSDVLKKDIVSQFMVKFAQYHLTFRSYFENFFNELDGGDTSRIKVFELIKNNLRAFESREDLYFLEYLLIEMNDFSVETITDDCSKIESIEADCRPLYEMSFNFLNLTVHTFSSTDAETNPMRFFDKLNQIKFHRLSSIYFVEVLINMKDSKGCDLIPKDNRNLLKAVLPIKNEPQTKFENEFSNFVRVGIKKLLR